MQKLKVVLQAITGYAGSSESPEKISARFMGVSMGTITMIAPFIAGFFSTTVEMVMAQIQPLMLVVAIVFYFYGMIRAVWSALKAHPTLGGYLK